MKPKQLTLSILLLSSSVLQANSLPPNYERAATLNKLTNNAGELSAENAALIDNRQPLQRDEFMPSPNFLWAAPHHQSTRSAITNAKVATRHADIAQAARQHLARYAPLYRLSATAQASAKVRHIQALAQGGYVVQFVQQVNGVDVLAQRMNMLLDDSLQLIAVSGQLMPEITNTSQATAATNKLSAKQAIAAAFQDLHQEPLATKCSTTHKTQGAYQWFEALANNNRHQLRQPVRLKPVWYPLKQQLEPAYYLELNTLDENQQHADYAYVVSAGNGAVLARHNLTQYEAAPAFTYRVWADKDSLMPYDSPYGTELTPLLTPIVRPPVPVASNLITLSCSVSKVCDPWLPANATQTIGNNVMAYADLKAPDGFSANDVLGTVSAANIFDYDYKFSVFDNARNGDQLQAAIVQAFYTTNLMHDWLYDHGFDETAGNGQANNYGRGGIDSDRMLVEVNDYSGFDNANMSTPADGAAPKMQLFPWTHENRRLKGTINGLPFDHSAIPAYFGASKFNLSDQKIVLVDDGSTTTGSGAAGSSSDGCNMPMQNADALAGAVALVDRGGCSFYKKVKNLQAAGVGAVLIANNQTGGMLIMKDTDLSAILDFSIQFPILGISRQTGKTLKQALAQNATINATLLRRPLPYYSSALDNSIVIHEWAHFLSNRLIWLNNNQGNSMGEGWSDFLALLAMVKEQDRQLTGNEQFQAPYAVSQYAGSDGLITYQYPLGIRRYPYSTDLNKNPLTFKHIKNGVPLPKGIKAAPNTSMSGDDNSEVHNSGEVWATMLWEAYTALLNDTPRLTFTEAQNRMLDYLVASLKMTPDNPTFLEARDALLAVAKVRDAADYNLFWKAFAKRGAGLNAKAPGRYSWLHAGVKEDYTTP